MKLQLFSAKTKSYQSVQIATMNDIKISKSCLEKKNKMNCQAWLAIQKKVADQSAPSPMLGHPAARYCLANNAKNQILRDENQREYDYCVFSDGSMVDAWSLYNRHHK